MFSQLHVPFNLGVKGVKLCPGYTHMTRIPLVPSSCVGLHSIAGYLPSGMTAALELLYTGDTEPLFYLGANALFIRQILPLRLYPDIWRSTELSVTKILV